MNIFNFDSSRCSWTQESFVWRLSNYVYDRSCKEMFFVSTLSRLLSELEYSPLVKICKGSFLSINITAVVRAQQYKLLRLVIYNIQEKNSGLNCIGLRLSACIYMRTSQTDPLYDKCSWFPTYLEFPQDEHTQPSFQMVTTSKEELWMLLDKTWHQFIYNDAILINHQHNYRLIYQHNFHMRKFLLSLTSKPKISVINRLQ